MSRGLGDVYKRQGMQFVELPQQWDEIEPKPGKFTNQWLDVADAYYPQVGVKLSISLNPIDTNSLRLPGDLKGKPLDHPDVIARYTKAVDYVLVHDDIGAVAQLYDGKPVYFLEIGYPSSRYLGSSEKRQAEFVKEVFKAWDQHKAQVRAMNFIWLHDISTAEINTYKQYYGVNARGFGEYLGTLGLRTHNGEDKQAFKTLQQEAAVRGW